MNFADYWVQIKRARSIRRIARLRAKERTRLRRDLIRLHVRDTTNSANPALWAKR